MEKDVLFKKRMTELSKEGLLQRHLTFSDFLDLNEQTMLQSLSLKDTGVSVKLWGGYETAERQMQPLSLMLFVVKKIILCPVSESSP